MVNRSPSWTVTTLAEKSASERAGQIANEASRRPVMTHRFDMIHMLASLNRPANNFRSFDNVALRASQIDRGQRATQIRYDRTQRRVRRALWNMRAKELAAEMLNHSGFDTDADRKVLPVAEDFDLSGHLHTISFSQRFDQTIRSTDRHVNGAGVILQREGGIPAFPS